MSLMKTKILRLEEARRRKTQSERNPRIFFCTEDDLSGPIPPTARIILPMKSESIAAWVTWVAQSRLAERATDPTLH